MNTAERLSVDPIHCMSCTHAGVGHERGCPYGDAPQIVTLGIPEWILSWARPRVAKVIPIESARARRRAT